ncbi:nucleotidyltransferase domain-containing protein [Plantactinospora sp. KLBMP9567]|uniref:nucleotidyltransferase domain-containing protein n=1 Tax=Plantactinospora sp. KLBMP9567 TaxID=3085900 RepID=UPI002981D38A|nr:hypothetical protein [Plantactinospora sp. KLBMP9567]MDW5322536.1 hypothetical protein [Plantactinospora sp. KLBMP9567]
MTPDLAAWDPWPPSVVADRLAGLDLPWYVAAGWAIDLCRGASSRPHDDLEIAVPAERFAEVRQRFGDCGFAVPHDGRLLPLTPESMRTSHQTWAYERATGQWRLDVFREPHDGGVWICRRDDRIRRPYADIVRYDPDGVPYLVPEVVLLFKAKAVRAKDEADFATALPLLDDPARRWLDDALALVHPTHPWRARLTG